MLFVAAAAALVTLLIATSQSSAAVQLRSRRPEACREQLPRRPEELASVVLVARLLELAPAADQRALLQVRRLFRGPASLASGSNILVEGLLAAPPATNNDNCPPNNPRPNDTLILMLEPQHQAASSGTPIIYRPTTSTTTFFPMNLRNLERISALASGEPHKNRAPIADFLCEAHYCPYGRCRLDQRNQTACHCPDTCDSPDQVAASGSLEPLCGSDNTTYPNECQLIRQGCLLKRPLFVTKLTAC